MVQLNVDSLALAGRPLRIESTVLTIQRDAYGRLSWRVTGVTSAGPLPGEVTRQAMVADIHVLDGRHFRGKAVFVMAASSSGDDAAARPFIYERAGSVDDAAEAAFEAAIP